MPLFCMVAIVVILMLVVLARRAEPQTNDTMAEYTLVWSDEFDDPEGSRPCAKNWTCEVGGGGFGNHESETYTCRSENAVCDGNSNLVITARKETFTGPDGITQPYTSARIITKGKVAVQYGRIEARIKIPFGKGIWPAFWMMGDNIDEVGWPDCREMDIMENVGHELGTNHGSLHLPGFSGGNSLTGSITLPNREKLSDDFHVYAIDWEPGQITFLLDGKPYVTQKASELKGKQWGFDRPFFFLLNVAVGGDWPGSPNETTTFPQRMLVDYIRVYRRTPVA